MRTGTMLVARAGLSSAPIRAARNYALAEEYDPYPERGIFGTSGSDRFAYEEKMAAPERLLSELAAAGDKALVRGTPRQIQPRLQLRVGRLKREMAQSW